MYNNSFSKILKALISPEEIYNKNDISIKDNEYKKYFDEICTYLNQTKSSLQVSNFFIVITGDIFDSNNFEDECVGLFLNFIENTDY